MGLNGISLAFGCVWSPIDQPKTTPSLKFPMSFGAVNVGKPRGTMAAINHLGMAYFMP